MCLVDDDRRVAAQQPVALDFGQQDPVGHHLELGPGGHFAGETHLETHLFADAAAQLFGDAFGHGAGGQSARLGVSDHPALGQPQLDEHLR